MDLGGELGGRTIIAVAGGDEEFVFSELLVDRFDAVVIPGDNAFGGVAAAGDVDFVEPRVAPAAFPDHFNEEATFRDAGAHAGVVDRHPNEIETVLEGDMIVGFMGKRAGKDE